MLKKLLPILMLVIGVSAFTSCNNSESNETVTTQTFTEFYGLVENVSDGSVMSYKGVSYQLDINYTNLTANLTVTGLKLPNGDSFPALQFSNVPWTMEGNVRRIFAQRVTPTAVGMSNLPTFTYFEFRIIDRILGAGQEAIYFPGVSCSMVIADIYSFTSTYFPQSLWGKTVSISALNATEYSTDKTSYEISFNKDSKNINIMMYNARFDPNMDRGLNIELRNIPVKVRAGKLTFDVAEITPFIGDTPFTQFPISALNGTFDFTGGLDMEFICTPRTAPGAYTVTVNTSFSDLPSESID